MTKRLCSYVAEFLLFLSATVSFAQTFTDRVGKHDVSAWVDESGPKPVLKIKYTNPITPNLDELRDRRMHYRDFQTSDPSSRETWKVGDAFQKPYETSIRSVDELNSLYNKLDPAVLNSKALAKAIERFQSKTAGDDEDRKKSDIVIENFFNAVRKNKSASELADFKLEADFSLPQHSLIAVHQLLPDGKCKSVAEEFKNIEKRFKEENRQIVRLEMSPLPVTKATKGTSVLYSFVGEHNIPITANEVTITGGWTGNCLRRGIQESIRTHFRTSDQPLKINLPMGAIYDSDNLGDGPNVPYCLKSLEDLRNSKGNAAAVSRVLEDGSTDGILNNESRSLGRMNEEEFTVEAVVNGHPLPERPPIGKGKKKVILEFWSPGQHPLERSAPHTMETVRSNSTK